MKTNPSVVARQSRGFTLIELLVVVAIIALLISILLPSLKQAREQGKRVKCLSQTRDIARAQAMYFIENDSYPFAYSYFGNNQNCPCGWCTWSFGGWLGKNIPFWNAYNGGCYVIPSNKRPLTIYMAKNFSVPKPLGAGLTLNEISDQPLFKCPSDKATYQTVFVTGGQQANQTFSAYNDVGSSYQQNFYWWFQTSCPVSPADADGDGKIEKKFPVCLTQPVPGCASTNWHCRFTQGRSIWKSFTEKNTSRFCIVSEDPFDFAIVNEIPTLGFHGQFSRHNMGFLDNHAEYLKPDTSASNDRHAGTEWTVIDEDFEAPWNNW